MASEIDICNTALAYLGDEANVPSIDPVEGSVQAEQCARFYPTSRDSLQSMHPWSFCTLRTVLAPLVAPPAFGWSRSYAVPARTLRVLDVLDSDGKPVPYELEADTDGSLIVLTNADEARLHYIRLEEDTERFPALFTEALAWLLASKLAGPLLRGKVGASAAQSCLGTFYNAALPAARLADTRQRRVTPEHTPDWMAAR